MTLTRLARVLVRRWLLVVLGVFLSMGLGLGVAFLTSPDYKARGLVMLYPVASQETGMNPFLNLGGLELPAGVLTAYFSGDAAQQQIAAESPDAKVTVSIEDSTRGPIIAIDVVDSTAASTMKTLSFVADQIPAELASLQTQVGAGRDVAVRSMPLTIDNRAQVDYSRYVRTIIFAVLLGLVVSALLIFAIDGLLTRRANIRGAGSARTVPAVDEKELPTDDGHTEPTAGAEAARDDGTERTDKPTREAGSPPDQTRRRVAGRSDRVDKPDPRSEPEFEAAYRP